MTVSVLPTARPIAATPPVTRPVAPTDVSHPHGVLRRGQANGTSASSSTLRPVAPTDVSYPHVTSCPERTNGTYNSSSTPFLSHPTAASSWFHGASHEPHPPIAPCSVRSRVSFTLSPTLHTSHSTPACSFPPRRKRSRRCFVCGGTGKHRLNPRFCPRTYELLSKHLAKFDANFRLVSDDGSPLPMTRHPGGVAAHLLSPRRLSPRTVRVAPRSGSKSPGTSQSNPPHVHRAPHAMPTNVIERLSKFQEYTYRLNYASSMLLVATAATMGSNSSH